MQRQLEALTDCQGAGVLVVALMALVPLFLIVSFLLYRAARELVRFLRR